MKGVKWAIQNKSNMLNYIYGKTWDLEIFLKRRNILAYKPYSHSFPFASDITLRVGSSSAALVFLGAGVAFKCGLIW